MSVREYSLIFNSLARYAPNVITSMEDRVHQFSNRFDSYVVRDYTIALLNKEMDKARMQSFAQKLEDKRQRRRTQELEIGNSKRARSMGKHTPSQAEFKPRLSDRPPRTSSFYCTTFSQPRFQGFRGNKFGQIK